MILTEYEKNELISYYEKNYKYPPFIIENFINYLENKMENLRTKKSVEKLAKGNIDAFKKINKLNFAETIKVPDVIDGINIYNFASKQESDNFFIK